MFVHNNFSNNYQKGKPQLLYYNGHNIRKKKSANTKSKLSLEKYQESNQNSIMFCIKKGSVLSFYQTYRAHLARKFIEH